MLYDNYMNDNTKVNDVYVVEIGFDWGFKWKTFLNLPSKYISTHEFTDYKQVDEYLKYADEVSKDGLGKFLYKLSKVPIKYSKKFKKI